LRVPWEALCEQSEHEGESLTALQAEGATQAPVIEGDYLCCSFAMILIVCL
jgi:hypothetical protein